MIKKISLAVIAIVIGLIAAAEIFTDSSGFNFNIISEDDATVEFAPGNYSGKRLTSSGLSTVSYNGKTYNIVAFGKECFKNQQPIIGTGTAWFDAGIAYIDSAAFEGTTIISSNEATVGGANTLGLRANPITWHPKAFVGNMLGNFQPINDTRFLNISETQALGMQHRGVLMSRDKTTVYVFPGDKRNGTNRSAGVLSSYAFLAQVTTVADYAFSGNSKLTSVNFSSCQVATIGEEAFSHSVLTSFTVPATVTTLGPGFIAGNKKISSIGVASGNTAYKSVDGMVYTIDDATLVAVPAKTTELTIPEGVTAIAAKADLDGSLTEVTIPSTVASIGVDAFVGNPNITSVYCNAVNPPSRGMFDDAVYSGATLVLPAGANKAAYEADPYWGKFLNIQQLGGGVPTDPFKDGNLWYKPTSDSTVTIIPNQEADNYTGVQSSWFETSVRHALGYTFTVTAIADSAFMNATVNGAISNIPVTVTSIGVDAFYGANVTTLTIPANVTSLGDGFATNNKSLTAITVADGNTAYKSIDGNVYTIDGETLVAVAGAKTALTVADNTITIAPRADYNGSLNTLALPASLTTIGENAFVGNSAITAIASNATVPPTGAVFDQVVYDNVVPVIPEGSQSAYEADANWKKFFPDYVRPTEPFQVGNLWYQAIDDDNVVIVGNPDGAYTGVAAAWFVENITYSKTHNFTVTAIADSAFAGATITGIAIPATIATIGNYVFDGSNIASLTIPATVTSLGEGVIARTTSLNAVSVADGNANYTAIGGCIYNADGTVLLAAPSGITTVELADNVTETAATAFLGAKNITKVTANPATAPAGGIFENEVYQNATLWYSAESAASYAGHENWSKFVNVKTIGDFDTTPFQDGNFYYQQINGTEAIIVAKPDGTAYGTSSNPIKVSWYKNTVTNPNGETLAVVGIGPRVFDGATYQRTNSSGTSTSSTVLFNVIPALSNMREYRDYAFTGCNSPIWADHSGVQTIAPKAFYGNKIRRIFTYDGTTNTFTHLTLNGDMGILFNKAGNKLLVYPGDMRTGGNCKDTDSKQTTFTADATAQTIGTYAFGGNSNLTSITINAVTVEEGAFEGCSALTTFKAASNLVTMGDLALANCSNLTTVELPATVTTISETAFSGSKNITTIKVDATVPPTGGVFEPEVYENAELVIPDGCEAAYRNADGWKNFYDDGPIVVTDPFQANGFWYHAVDDSTAVLVANPEGAYTNIAASWFNETVTRNDGNVFTVVAIGDSALAGSTVNGTFAIPASITTIGSYAFDGSNIASLTIPATVTSLGEGVIARTTSLNAVSVADGNANYTAIGGCIYNADGTVLLAAPSGITTVELAGDVTETAATAFLGAKNITKVTANPATAPVGGIFENEVYQNATLWINTESEASYTGHENWSKFNTIKHIGEFEAVPFQDGKFWYRPISADEAEIIPNPNGQSYGTIASSDFKDVVTNADGAEFTVVAIGEYAMKGVVAPPRQVGSDYFSQITNVTLPHLREIKDYAFTEASGDVLRIYNSPVQQIAPTAFAYNTLHGILCNGSDVYGQITEDIAGQRYLITKDSTKVVAVPGNNRTGTLWEASLKTSVAMPATFQIIGAYSFSGNPNLKTITVNANTIEECAFIGAKVQTFTAASNLVTVDSAAFANCSALKTVNLPATVTTISDSAFVGSKNITTIKIDAMTPPTGGVFEPEVYENATLVIPEDAEPAYRAAAGWSNFFDTITGDVDNDGVVDVADINLLINIMLHYSEATANSDVNNDGEIDVADINMVVLIMLSE